MAIMEHLKANGRFVIGDARRSTRLPCSVRLSVSGQNSLGSVVSDLTSTVMVNCHGCVYSSRYEYRSGSWVTLEVPNPQLKGSPRPVRAQVRFTRMPRSPKELYQIGVELETPANVWGIDSPPQDWLRFPISDSGTQSLGISEASSSGSTSDLAQRETSLPGSAGPANLTGLQGFLQGPLGASPDAERLLSAEVFPEQLLRGLEGKVQLAVDKAAASAVAVHLNSAVNHAVMAIDNFSQASVRQVEKDCALLREKLVASAREEVVGKVQVDLAQAQERLRMQFEVPLAEAKRSAEALQKSVTTEIHLVLAEAVDCLKTKTAEVQDQFAVQVAETSDKAAAELGAETVRFSDRQLARVASGAQAATTEASTRLEAGFAEATARLEAVSSAALIECQRRVESELEQTATRVLQSFEASLNLIGSEIRADSEDHQRSFQAELGLLSEQESAQFRQRMGAILASSTKAALSAVNEHSKLLLESLSQSTEEPLMEAKHGFGPR